MSGGTRRISTQPTDLRPIQHPRYTFIEQVAVGADRISQVSNRTS